MCFECVVEHSALGRLGHSSTMESNVFTVTSRSTVNSVYKQRLKAGQLWFNTMTCVRRQLPPPPTHTHTVCTYTKKQSVVRCVVAVSILMINYWVFEGNKTELLPCRKRKKATLYSSEHYNYHLVNKIIILFCNGTRICGENYTLSSGSKVSNSAL